MKAVDDTVFEARIRDAVRLAKSGNRPRFAGFLDERQAGVAQRLAKAERCENFLLWGGYPGAERVFFGAFPSFLAPRNEAFPIAALTVSYRACDRLTHRDFLGALLHAGVERAALGDILVGEGRCVLFCRDEISGFLRSQVSKIGGVGVKIAGGATEPLPQAHRFAEFSAVVASARLDCIVAAAAGTGREKAARMVRAGFVMVDHEENLSPDARVQEGSLLSVRGCGRYWVDRLGPVTKKGRLCVGGRKFV